MTESPIPIVKEAPIFRLRTITPPKSLLIIEDDLSLVQFIDSILESLYPKLHWEYVTSGEAALDLLKRRALVYGDRPYSLVLSDIYLEGEVTGLDVFLLCQKVFPEMPFVLTSAVSRERYLSIIEGIARGPEYVPKPLTVRGCQKVFEEYL